MERRLVARMEAKERMLKEGRGKEVMDEDVRKLMPLLLICMVMMGFLYLMRE
jgi:hypothetical protein